MAITFNDLGEWTHRLRTFFIAGKRRVKTAPENSDFADIRVEFQDERGLLRKGAIAAGDPVTHEQLRALLGNSPLK